jgi:hypothetical protein
MTLAFPVSKSFINDGLRVTAVVPRNRRIAMI